MTTPSTELMRSVQELRKLDIYRGRKDPVDPLLILGVLGVDIFEATVKNNALGLLRHKPQETTALYLHRGCSPTVLRSVAAHELSYYVHYGYQQEGTPWHHLHQQTTRVQEARLWAFARELLIPTELLPRKIGPLSHVVLAPQWGVTPEVMRQRIHDLPPRRWWPGR